jgi:cytochrome c biogenesis protein
MLKKALGLLGSVQLVIPLLITITLVSLLGVVIPQGLPPLAYAKMGAVQSSIILALGLNMVFYTWWFYALLGLLSINILACSISHQLKRLHTSSKLRFLPSSQELAAQKCSVQFSTHLDPRKAAAIVGRYLRSHLFVCASQPLEKGIQLAARSMHIRELGSFLFHISILFFFTGGIVGLIAGHDTVSNLGTGEVAAVEEWPYLIRCDWFKLEKNASGAIADYKSKLTVLSLDSAELLTKVIEVNHPLNFRGVSFYQSSYGEETDACQEANLLITGPGLDTNGIAVSAPFDAPIRIPGDSISLTVRQFVCDFVIDMDSRTVTSRSNRPNNPAILVEMFKGPDTLFNNWAFTKYPEMHKVGKNRYTVVFLGYQPRYYTGLKVTRNPGAAFIWLGFALMTLGIMMVFYFHPKNVWILIEEIGKEGSRVTLGASSKQPLSVFQHEFNRLSASMKSFLEKRGT